jgi:hypothetical protein
MNSGGFSPGDEIEKIIKQVRDKSLMMMRMSGNNNTEKLCSRIPGEITLTVFLQEMLR